MRRSDEEQAARALAAAWSDLEVEPLAERLATNVRYESPGVEMILEGRAEVVSYLRRKMELIEMAGEDARIVARAVRLHHRGGDRWAVLSSQGGLARAAVFLPSVDARGEIESIEVLTDADLLEAADRTGGAS